jgi:hypothetical protein
VKQGSAEHPDIVVSTDLQTFSQLVIGYIQPEQAIAAERLAVAAGDPNALNAFLKSFNLPDQVACPPS